MTPSPSDITMDSPSPVEIISIDISEAVIKKNIHNSPKSNTLIDSIDNDRMREKFLNVIAENGNKLTGLSPKFTYPGQAKQIIATETGESQIFREVGSSGTSTNIENIVNDIQENLDTTKDNISTENNFNDDEKIKIIIEEKYTAIDGNISPLNLDCEQSIELIELEQKVEVSITIVEEDSKNKQDKISEIKENVVALEKKSPPTLAPKREDMQPTCSDGQAIYDRLVQVRKSLIDLSPRCDDIDGKFVKSVVNARKSPKRVKNLTEQVVPMMEEPEEIQKPKKREKNVPKTDSHRKIYQGSLESINFIKPTILAQKSKSFEFIKSDLSLKEFKPQEIDAKKSPDKSSSSSFVTITEPEHIYENQPLDDYCSECCSSKNEALAGKFPRKNLYTVRSTNSSPQEVDSGECEICSSCHIEDNEILPEEPQCELCEICGDIAMEMDVVASSRPESDDLVEARMLSGSGHSNLGRRNLASGRVRMDGKIFEIADEDADGEEDIDEPTIERAPSTSVDEFSADDSTLDDVEFEIENCGLELDTNTDVKVSVIPENNDITEEKEMENLETTDETKRMTRGSSMITRTADRPDSKRRYSSVDDLPISKQIAKTILKEPGQFVTKSPRKVTGSVDNIQISRINKSPNKFRLSADDVGKKCQETDETADDDQKTLALQKNVKTSRSEPDVKFIISKHGLQIISDRETAF